MDENPDRLSDWTVPPGEIEPVRVFESAEAALAFLSRETTAAAASPERQPRRFSSAAAA
jgi:hypothetical protein